MNKMNPRYYLLGPSKDPIRNDLNLYYLVRFKDKLVKISIAKYKGFFDSIECMTIPQIREMVNVIELQIAMGLTITGAVTDELIQMVKDISGKKRDSTAKRILSGDQYSFREILLRYSMEQMKKKKANSGRMKISWDRI